jgi:hypothetical protein
MSYSNDSGYVVPSGGYRGGHEVTAKNALKWAGLVVPGSTLVSEHVDDWLKPDSNGSHIMGYGKLIAAMIGCVLLLIFVSFTVASGVRKMLGMSAFQGMADAVATLGNRTPWGGPPGPVTEASLQLSDPAHDPKVGSSMRQPFLGTQTQPEFFEMPNYVLGNENMMRTALNNYTRLKANPGKMPVPDWSTYWAAYQANHADDLTDALYTFGEDQGMRDRPDAATRSAALMTARSGI